MSEEEVVKFNLKAVINKQKNRVLFVEVGNDFVDLLFSFLILPLGNIMQVLQKHYGDKTPRVNGSLNTLYNSLANLVCHRVFKSDGYKPMILSRDTAYAFPHLSMKVKFDSNMFSLGKAYFVVYKIFTNDKDSFIICDDLRVVPNVKGSIVQTLNNVGVDMVHMDGSSTRDVTFGLNEVMDFLLASLISRRPLTDVILGTTVKSELRSCISGIPLPQIQTEAIAIPKKMVLKAMLQKSTKKFLFAQAEKDFVSYLFSLIETPLGLVDLHLRGNSSFNNLGNLYKSIADQVVDRNILWGLHLKDDLMQARTFSRTFDFFDADLLTAVNHILKTDRSRMYMVNDDLTVTLLYVTSAMSRLGQMKISPSDVEEVEFHIGLEEASNILKASLTSSCALSDGLITPHLKKKLVKPKQEQ